MSKKGAKMVKNSSKRCSNSPIDADGGRCGEILVIGNPNAGKSTIFNTLTRGRAHTGNYNGVTVDASTRSIAGGAGRYEVTDLPGIYGLEPYSPDEINAVTMLQRHPDAICVNVVDANTLAKSLHLTLQLIEAGRRVIVLANFAKKAADRGVKIDYVRLSGMLGVPVLALDFFADDFVAELLRKIEAGAPTSSTKTHQKREQVAGCAIDRQSRIDEIVRACVESTRGVGEYAFCRADRWLTRPLIGVLFFLAVMLAIFALTFGTAGSSLAQCVNFGWQLCAKFILSLCSVLHAPVWLMDFLEQGVLASIGGVIGFLPQVCLLWFCLEFLEQSGYIARVVWLLEPVLGRWGLSGKSVFGMLLGFGCTAIALPSVLAIKSGIARQKTASILPFVTCNARLPVLSCVASAIFPSHAVLAVFLLYLLGIITALVVAKIWQVIQPTPPSEEIVEFTPLMRPRFKTLCVNTARTAGHFLRKIWSIVLVFGMIIWFISNFDFCLQPVSIEESMLAQISGWVAPVFAPLGLGWGSVVALVVGVVAKEMVLSCMAVLNGAGNLAISLVDPTSIVHFDLTSGVAFLVFCTLYTPCISALGQLRAVLSKRAFWAQLVMQLAVAWGASSIAALFCRAVVASGWSGALVALGLACFFAILLFFVLKKKKKCSKCDGKCNFCFRR